MAQTPEILFAYLRDLIYSPSDASLNLDELDPEYRKLGEGLDYFKQLIDEQRNFAKALAKGDLGAQLPSSGNELAAPLKALHASLKHMTWQSQQVAKGDYKQRVDFMGEFADAFNTMIQQLDAREQALEAEIERSYRKTRALEQSNNLLANITSSIQQQIFVFGRDSGEILFHNNAAREMLDREAGFLGKLQKVIGGPGGEDQEQRDVEITWGKGEDVRYYTISIYPLEWNGAKAVATVVTDVSEGRRQMQLLESYAYYDNLTNLYNRYAGMQTLSRWLEEGRSFSLCFVDLDNLKYINDNFGHSAGDVFIIHAARYLRGFSKAAVPCRLGGDEFMLLAPDWPEEDAARRMEELRDLLQGCVEGEPYYYSMSYGVCEVGADNTYSASELLGIADEKMYNYKRLKRRMRSV